MLSVEWNMDDALAVSHEEGIEIGMERGIEKGLEEGSINIAKSALAEGLSIGVIQKITGLNEEAIIALQTK